MITYGETVSMYAPQELPAVLSSVLASSVIVMTAMPGLLPPCLVPAIGPCLHIPVDTGERPLAYTVRFVQGVYFALRRRGLDAQEASRKNVSLVLPHKGKNKGKQSFLW